ncbi:MULTISPECIES: glycoside hydrolase family 15 [Thermomonospora]|uniref:Glycoside hydrolase 15-related protein n=1 Tax=Thermomonospora curvata (strain ATCC 19995 / DSM 43183 / JCM 3096 / KCTC 9072 / NBRC 15933 / NCIMB 10081 / Henssen B9) TaxID=471852 RepID=D1A296_THECD|nr:MULTISPECIES: glycoside hydrolase family 15 [Thermomonospora]ACY99749.1 glycoside hydrolase 15-related protein [Thermomonospora curvata DSM 43183]PKK12757.1 MAG: glycoside hydrolase family 15 [Thermomonospora sp. CIF 1]
MSTKTRRGPVRPPAARPARRGGAARRRRTRRLVAFAMVMLLAATCGATLPGRPRPQWTSPGLIGGGGWPLAYQPLQADEAAGASYLPDSSVVRLADGRVRLIRSGGRQPITVAGDDPRVAVAVRGDRLWLADGRIPGGDSVYRDMAVRALLDLRLLTGVDGAVTASWYRHWRYVWPRDAAFVAAAFQVSGHPEEARRVLRFLARVQADSGLWAARYRPDGSPVADGRAPQLDSLGWVLWAGWFVTAGSSAPGADELWPMVRRAADYLAGSLDAAGLPPPSPDYFERDPDKEADPHRPTLGVAGPVLTGLRAAADLASRIGHAAEAGRWRRAARRLAEAIAQAFAPHGYPRSPVAGGLMDTSPTFLGPPFAPADPGVEAAVLEAARRLRLPNGGVLPGERWRGAKTVAWTPEMALFALNAAACGRVEDALRRLDWLNEHRTELGALPEKVNSAGRPAAVAPLGWTAALVLLTLAALEEPLPIPPP